MVPLPFTLERAQGVAVRDDHADGHFCPGLKVDQLDHDAIGFAAGQVDVTVPTRGW